MRSALSVFNTNKSHQVSSTEFKRSCRIYGYEGNAGTLFRALDVERDGFLSTEEVAFLDDWEVDDTTVEVGKKAECITKANEKMPKLKKDFDVKITKSQEERKAGKLKLDSKVFSAESENVAKPRPPDSKQPKSERMPLLDRGSCDTPRRQYLSSWKPLNRKVGMWCSICKIRGLCIHMADQAQNISRPNSSANVRSLSLRESSTPDRPRAASSLSWRSPRSRSESARNRSPQASQDETSSMLMHSFDTSIRFASSMNCGGSDAEIQYAALRKFPMGTVSPVQANLALHTLSSNMDTLNSVWSSIHLSSVQDM